MRQQYVIRLFGWNFILRKVPLAFVLQAGPFAVSVSTAPSRYCRLRDRVWFYRAYR
jgi:hypothetical protein